MSSGKPTLDSLFPTPARPPSRIAPARWPGITPKSVETLKKVLKDNYQRWHIFINDRGYHKYERVYLIRRITDDLSLSSHAAHRALAVWATGADSAIIEAGYEKDSSYLKKTYTSPNPITLENFEEYLGDRA